MTDAPEKPVKPKAATQALADLVAARKAAAASKDAPPGRWRPSEKTASARSAAKSKPALRK